MKNESVLLTIYTPTYNRANLLERVYKSLCQQTCKAFIWHVIDDGSTDNTSDLIKGWMENNVSFEIRYSYKPNGGVHTARDMAYRLCDTELIISCDSDDWLSDDAVQKIIECWNNRTIEDVLGIMMPCAYSNGNAITQNFPNAYAMPWQDVFYKYHCVGDTNWVYRSDLIKATEDAPEFEGERLIGELYKCLQLPKNMPIILLHEYLCIVEYQADGYTSAAYSYMFKNPKGFREDCRQRIINGKYLPLRIKGYLGYIASSILIDDKEWLVNSPSPIKVILLYPLGLLAGLILRRREKQVVD